MKSSERGNGAITETGKRFDYVILHCSKREKKRVVHDRLKAIHATDQSLKGCPRGQWCAGNNVLLTLPNRSRT